MTATCCHLPSQKRNHVEMWMFQMVLDFEGPLLPKDPKTARLLNSQVGGALHSPAATFTVSLELFSRAFLTHASWCCLTPHMSTPVSVICRV